MSAGRERSFCSTRKCNQQQCLGLASQLLHAIEDLNPNFLNHITWYSAIDWKRPYPGESKVELPGPFVKAAKKYLGDDDDK